MQIANRESHPIQYMSNPDFEFFHYRDRATEEVEYHNHDFYEIYIPLASKTTYIVEGKTYKVGPGDIVLVNNRELHKPLVELGAIYERIVIWVNPSFIASKSDPGNNLSLCFESSSKKKYNLLRPKLDTFNSIRTVIAKLEMACSSTGFGCDILKVTYLTELLVYLNRAFLDKFDEEIETDIEFNEKVSDIIQHINENLDEDLSLDALSSRFYLSKYHLLREFKKHAGYSIHQYIQRKRLILAKSLLRQGMQVTEVFMRCGFGDYSNFIRAFKKAFGTSPKKYCKTNVDYF